MFYLTLGIVTESAVPGCAFVPGTQNIYIEFVILLIYDLGEYIIHLVLSSQLRVNSLLVSIGMLVLSLIPVIQIRKS